MLYVVTIIAFWSSFREIIREKGGKVKNADKIVQRDRDTNKLTDPFLADDKFDKTLTLSHDKYYEITLNKFAY